MGMINSLMAPAIGKRGKGVAEMGERGAHPCRLQVGDNQRGRTAEGAGDGFFGATAHQGKADVVASLAIDQPGFKRPVGLDRLAVILHHHAEIRIRGFNRIAEASGLGSQADVNILGQRGVTFIG